MRSWGMLELFVVACGSSVMCDVLLQWSLGRCVRGGSGLLTDLWEDMAMTRPFSKVLSCNVRGMGSMAKRHKILAYMKRRGVQIAMLQESHLTQVESDRLRRRWRGQLFTTTYSAYARVAVWVRAGVLFEPINIDIDKED
ncbi:hypothetical protein NDU88_000093 [Pleurodeles waltl]|uniref:Uncharacterized protein n=1 Tax=Pleurodeles waltl TaxID=8319 RepID=A0AAV7UP07_PLEWA|nr:hypothetical protein NDU88_000093 [Pleurodeles waltl]